MKPFHETIGEHVPDTTFIYERTDEAHTHYNLDKAEMFVNSRGRTLLAERALFWQPMLLDMMELASRNETPEALPDFSLYHVGAKSQLYIHDLEEAALWYSSDVEYLMRQYFGGIGTQQPTGVALASNKSHSRSATIAIEISNAEELASTMHTANYQPKLRAADQAYISRTITSSMRTATKALLQSYK